MNRRSIGYVALAVGFLAFVVGFLQFGLMLEGIASSVAGVAVLAAIRWPTVGLAGVAAASLLWAIRFPMVGISVASTIAAYALAVGFASMAYARHAKRPAVEAVGMALAGAGNLWYLVDNSILSWTPGFAIGNFVFAIGTVLVLLAWRADTRAA